jgi:hypothetical protein
LGFPQPGVKMDSYVRPAVGVCVPVQSGAARH